MWSFVSHIAYSNEGVLSSGEEGFFRMFLRTIKILVPLVGPMHKQLAISRFKRIAILKDARQRKIIN